jgi:hypothetical protein
MTMRSLLVLGTGGFYKADSLGYDQFQAQRWETLTIAPSFQQPLIRERFFKVSSQ